MDLSSALVQLPFEAAENQGTLLRALLDAHGTEAFLEALSALMLDPPSPDDVDPVAWWQTMSIPVTQLLAAMGAQGEPLLEEMALATEWPSFLAAEQLLRKTTAEGATDAVIERAIRAFDAFDLAEWGQAPFAQNLLIVVLHQERLQDHVFARMKRFMHVGIPILGAWVLQSGPALVAAFDAELRKVLREGLVPLRVGEYALVAVGMRMNDVPVLGEFHAAELLLAQDRGDAEALAWLERQAAHHPDAPLRATAEHLLRSAKRPAPR